MSKHTHRRVVTALLGAAMVIAAAAPAAAAPEPSGFLTEKDPYITLDPGTPEGAEVTAIVSVGESVDGVLFEGIPDGIGLKPGPDKHTVEVFVTHEQSTVPFLGERDFQDSSRLRGVSLAKSAFSARAEAWGLLLPNMHRKPQTTTT